MFQSIIVVLTYFITGLIAGLICFVVYFSKKKLKIKPVEKGIGEEYNPKIKLTEETAEALVSEVDKAAAVNDYKKIQ